MREISERLFVGSESDHKIGDDEWAIVHACKSPCHQNAVGYRGNLSNSHPNYLIKEDTNDLYLNIIDPPAPLFMPPLFTSFLDFGVRHWEEGKTLLIHCNQGESRAPSLALLFLAKHKREIPNESYGEARAAFQMIDPNYQPGRGIQLYLTKHWGEF